MRKTISKILIAAFVLSSLTACGNDTKEPATSSDSIGSVKDHSNRIDQAINGGSTEEVTEVTSEEKTSETEASTEEKTENKTENKTEEASTEKTSEEPGNFWDIYDPVISEVYQTVKDGYDFDKDYNYITNGLMEDIMYQDKDTAMDRIGFYLVDLNDDNVPELLTGINYSYEDITLENNIYAGYSYVNGKIVTFLDGWARSNHSLMSNNHFAYVGSGGVGSQAVGEWHLSKEGTEIEWDDFYFIEYDGAGNENFYHNTTGIWDSSASEKVSSSADDFTKVYESYKAGALNWTSLGDLKNDNSATASSGTVSVTMEQDMTDLPSSYITYVPADANEYTVYVYFTTDIDVKNFKILDLQYKDVDEAGNITFDYSEKYSLDTLAANMPVRAGINFPGDIPNNGFMYRGADGVDHIYVIELSGKDGSLVTWQYN